MAEAAFRSVQIGKESTKGTEVNATIVLPVDAGSGELELIRGTNWPDEDYGRAIRNQTGRGSHGIGNVTGSVSCVATYQTLPHLLQMALGEVATTGSSSPFTHVIERDDTTDTSRAYTWEVNDDTQDWIGTGVVITDWELSFEALAAGQNAAWQFSGDLQGMTLTKGTATAALSAPAAETMEGHLTTFSHGAVGTAFGSLTAMAKLVSFSMSGSDPKPPRPYAGSDSYTAHGRRKGMCTVTATFQVHADTVGALWDIYAVAGAVPTERRWRLAIDGSGVNAATIDMRLGFTQNPVVADGRDGERLFSVTAETTYDATLETDLSIGITNATTSY